MFDVNCALSQTVAERQSQFVLLGSLANAHAVTKRERQTEDKKSNFIKRKERQS